jgi:hypothetical protein
MKRVPAFILMVLPYMPGLADTPDRAADLSTTNPADAGGSPTTQLDAATVDARETLRQDILSFPLTPDLSVGQLVDRSAGGSSEVAKLLQNAQQRGGTRWTTDQTCEVRLEVSGDDVVGAIRPILQANASRLPAPREALERGLLQLKKRNFSAVGKSTGTRNLFLLRPGPKAVAWRRVTDAERREAILTAKSNAVAHVVQSLAPVRIGGNSTLDDALNLPEVNTEIRDWIGARPVTEIIFGDDLGVSLTLSSPPDELWPVVQSALVRRHLGPPPSDGPAWDGIRTAMLQATAPAEGQSVATPTHPQEVPVNAQQAAPEWVARKLETDGAAEGSGLKAARIAEIVALQRLRSQLDALPLNASTTLGQAAKADVRISRALDTVINRAAVTKVDYQQRGIVKARVSLELEEVWRGLYPGR